MASDSTTNTQSQTVHSVPTSNIIKLEESQHWQHGENKAKKESQIWQHAEINRAKKKERKTQGNYTCQREKKKQQMSGKKKKLVRRRTK